jgi:EAL domain-containing protein (putative c-di-GMP-specific phosphodiesterase class I)
MMLWSAHALEDNSQVMPPVSPSLVAEDRLGERSAPASHVNLGEALARNWVEFWYQPKIDLRRKQLVGVEAFARARHPERGVLMPDAFISGAADSSLVRLSELALTTALQAGLDFAMLGIHLPMTINVPVRVLRQLDVVAIVQAYKARFTKWPGLLIDIKEGEIVEQFDLVEEITNRLGHLGVKLAIDEFGRDYSAVMRLTGLPCAELKLDRSFVTGCGNDPANAPLCKAVIELAHSFGSIAVGVGIERASDALALVNMGCDYGQGFLLGQPMPQDRFIALLRQRANAHSRHLS